MVQRTKRIGGKKFCVCATVSAGEGRRARRAVSAVNPPNLRWGFGGAGMVHPIFLLQNLNLFLATVNTG
jgi:hypothetical protein